jgi:hypothetical protein
VCNMFVRSVKIDMICLCNEINKRML